MTRDLANEIKLKVNKIWNSDLSKVPSVIVINDNNENLINENHFFDINKIKNDIENNKAYSSWIVSIYVEIIDLNKFIKCSNTNAQHIVKVLQTFYEGIKEILNAHSIKKINYLENGLFASIDVSSQDSIQARKMINAALEINGFLGYYWNQTDYKICLSTSNEIIIPHGYKNTSITYLNNSIIHSINLCKKINTRKNCIIFSQNFVSNNQNVLFNASLGRMYYDVDEIEEKDENQEVIKKEKIYYSTCHFDHWK